MDSFELNGREFRITDIPPKKEWNIIRRVAPIIKSLGALASVDAGILDSFKTITSDGEKLPLTKDRMDKMLDVAAPIIDQLAELSDDAMSYIIDSCLSAVQIHQGEEQGGVWTVVYNSNVKAFQHQVSTADMMALTVRVLLVIVPRFLAGGGQIS